MDGNDFIIFLVLLGMLFSSMPVFLGLLLTGMVGLVLVAGINPLIVIEVMYRSIDKFALVVVLFFILCGNIMTTGSIVQKLVKSANILVGWLPGGLSMAGVLACAMFGAISGSAVATVVAIGGFMIPALLKEGYDEKFTTGIMTTAPILGIVIPPSIALILYAMVSNDSVEALFLTGFIPGLLIIMAMCFYAWVVCRKQKSIEIRPRPTFAEVVAVLRESIWALLLPVLIFGGIYSGGFTANEAAVVSCLYAFFIEIVVHRDMKFRDVKQVVVSSAITSATLLVIVAGASVFGEFLTFDQIPDRIANAVVSTLDNKYTFLIAANLLLLFVGMFMDIISAILILTPIFLPLLAKFGIDTMHFGLLMTVNLGIGYSTPPLGVSLYITGSMTKRNLLYVSRAVVPFIIIQLLLLLLFTYVPDLVLFLPRLVLGYQG
jgi:tripartite ATP-independent transporter DctM subunit